MASPIDNISLKQWLQQQPYTLALSSGFFSFFCHCGVLSVLEQQNLLPAKLTGSSAGALIATCWASGLSTEQIANQLTELEKADFWDPGFGLGFLQGKKFRRRLHQILKVSQFEQCRVPLYLSVFNGISRRTEVKSTGALVPALYASCAVPLMFQPIWLSGKPYWDGGIKDRPALAAVEPGERVLYHHIPSKSPWRRKNSPALALPSQPGLISLQLLGIPRSGPDKLHLGLEILQLARAKTLQALDMPITDSVVTV